MIRAHRPPPARPNAAPAPGTARLTSWALLAASALPVGCGGEASPDAAPPSVAPGGQAAAVAPGGPATPTPTKGGRPAVRNIKNRGQSQ